jgi:very-short-patch-repair endonuclease
MLVPFAKELRKNMTKEERHLWYDYLKLCPFRFQRQKILGNFIADFYCAEAKIVIELDGSQHVEPFGLRQDHIRTAYLESQGVYVLRFSNSDVLQKFDAVCAEIDRTAKSRAGLVP